MKKVLSNIKDKIKNFDIYEVDYKVLEGTVQFLFFLLCYLLGYIEMNLMISLIIAGLVFFGMSLYRDHWMDEKDEREKAKKEAGVL